MGFRIHQVKARRSLLGDVSVGGWISNDFTRGQHGYQRARRGVKKYIASRIRFHEKEAVRRLARQQQEVQPD